MTAPVGWPYIVLYQPRADGVLESPGRPNLPFVPPPPPSTTTAFLSLADLRSTWSVTPPDVFVVGTTKPVLVDPLNPVGTDNVGWTGDTSGGTFTGGVHVVPSGTRRKGCVFLCDVQLTDSTSILDDCIVFGGSNLTGARPGMITASNGGQLNRVTVWGLSTSQVYYREGCRFQGNLTVMRSAFFRVGDALATGTGTLNCQGSMFARFAFFSNDLDHPLTSSSNATNPPNWTHNDVFQATNTGGIHQFIGNLCIATCDTTGVTWSGTPGSSTASNGVAPTVHPTTRPTVATPIGMPADQLNPRTFTDQAGASVTTPRFLNQWFFGLYCNLLSFTSVTGHRAVVTDNWLEASNDPSALVQFTVGTANQLTLQRNRYGVGGYRTLSSRKFLGSWSSSTPASQIDTGSGGNVNVFGDFQSCTDTTTLSGVSHPGGIVGLPVVVTSGGVRYTA